MVLGRSRRRRFSSMMRRRLVGVSGSSDPVIARLTMRSRTSMSLFVTYPRLRIRSISGGVVDTSNGKRSIMYTGVVRCASVLCVGFTVQVTFSLCVGACIIGSGHGVGRRSVYWLLSSSDSFKTSSTVVLLPLSSLSSIDTSGGGSDLCVGPVC